MVYRELDSLEKAEEYHLESLERSEKIGHLFGQLISYQNLGLVYSERGDYNKAMPLFRKAVAGFVELNDSLELANAYGNIGLLYMDLGKYDSSIFYHHKAFNIDERLGSRNNLAKDMANLSLVFARDKQYDSSLVYLDMVIVLYNKLGLDKDQKDAEKFRVSVKARMARGIR